jgi:hypothetical protein
VTLLHDEQLDDLRCAIVKAVQRMRACQGSDDARCLFGPFDDDFDGVAERLNQALPAEWYPSGTREPRTEVIELRSGL